MEALYSAAQLKEMDRWATETMGIASLTLMENAARAVTESAWNLGQKDTRTAPRPRKPGPDPKGDGKKPAEDKPPRCAVFCGVGKNGGDGFAAARQLRERGAQIRTFQVGDWDKMDPDTRTMHRRLVESGGMVEPFRADDRMLFVWLTTCDVVIDALFGVGLTRPVEGNYLDAVRCINRLSNMLKVLCVDLPTGVDADTGHVLGESVHAALTVTFHEKKYGLMLGEGAVCAGEVRLADIGIPTGLRQKSNVYVLDQASVRLPVRRRDAYKADFGRLYILAGSVGYTGAPVLAASAALRSGAGLITLGTPAGAWGVVAGKCLEVMAEPLPDDGGGRLSAACLETLSARLQDRTAVLVGPGLGRSADVETVVWSVLSHAACPVVLDADGLNMAAAHIDKLRNRTGITVLTPHDREFARLGGDLSGGNRLGAAQAFAHKYGCILVLKGHRTITAFPSGEAYVNTTGNPGMAKGGSGDVLAGVIASLLAQGIQPQRAVPAAVWLHGRAGDLCAAAKGEYGMTPGDMVEFLPKAFQEN